ncbi:hypothetical protein N5P37_012036 [Trichoderma harzianum]|nr:hypothetical protein N5P37_012036 [Trichoderma harzianum]
MMYGNCSVPYWTPLIRCMYSKFRWGALFSHVALAYSLFMDIYFIIFFPSDFPKRDEMIMSLLVLEYVKSIPRYYSVASALPKKSMNPSQGLMKGLPARRPLTRPKGSSSPGLLTMSI